MKTSEMIEVMQAFERGERIEATSREPLGPESIWFSTASPTWDWYKWVYRVKPKGPEKVYVLINKFNGYTYTCLSRKSAEEFRLHPTLDPENWNIVEYTRS